jgi:hypothetical protein
VFPEEIDDALGQAILQAEIGQRHIDANDKIGLLYAIRRLAAYARFLDGWATDQTAKAAPQDEETPDQDQKDDFDDIFN